MKYMSRRLTVAAIAFLAGSSEAAADDESVFDPDFHFVFTTCTTMGTGLNGPAKTKDGIYTAPATYAHHTACERTGKKSIDCLTVFDEPGAKPASYSMYIKVEASQLLIIESENGGDYLVVKPEAGRVVSTTRILGENFFASKMCHGMYLTGDEFKALGKRKAEAKPRKK